MLMPLKKALEVVTTRKAIVKISRALEENRTRYESLWWVWDKPPGAQNLLLWASQIPPLHLLLLLGWLLLGWLLLGWLLLFGLGNVLLGRHPQEMRQCLNSVVKVLLLWEVRVYCVVSFGKQYLQQKRSLVFVLFRVRICLQSSWFDFILERFISCFI